jgi:hypothetical protein
MKTTKTHQQNEIEEKPDNETEHKIPEEESESDNEQEELYENDKPDNDDVNDSNRISESEESDSSSSSGDEDEFEQRNKLTFSMKKSREEKFREPIKTPRKTSNALKSIKSSDGFLKASENTSVSKSAINRTNWKSGKANANLKLDKCMRQILILPTFEKSLHFSSRKIMTT